MINDSYGWLERVWIQKSGCIELGLHRCTVGNNATPTLCGVLGVAIYFFALVEAVSLASDIVIMVVVVNLALAALEPDFRHSLALWLLPPQNIHKFCLNLCLHSSEVSLPSLPSLSEGLGVLPDFLGVGLDEDEDWAELPEDDLLFSDLPEDLLVVLVLVLVLVEVLF